MTERKPPDLEIDSWVERQIREAADRGEFDNLPGAGKPLPDRGAEDELWWVRQKLEREGLSTDALLPTPVQLRKEIDRLARTVCDLPTEQEVRDVVASLNRRIAHYLRAPTHPRIPIAPVRADTVVAQWRAARTETSASAPGSAGPTDAPPVNRAPEPAAVGRPLRRRLVRALCRLFTR